MVNLESPVATRWRPVNRISGDDKEPVRIQGVDDGPGVQGTVRSPAHCVAEGLTQETVGDNNEECLYAPSPLGGESQQVSMP